MIRTDAELKMKMNAHTISITESDGVQIGMLIVLYHPLPVCAK